MDLSLSEQAEGIQMMKSFFTTAVQRLQSYLPYGNIVLRATQFLCPENQSKTKMVKWGLELAKNLPGVISETDTVQLTLEIRYLQSMRTGHNASKNDVRAHWTNLHQTGKYPQMVKLARAICVLPHGNADVERIFSNLHDILTKKRANMDAQTVTALIVSKSCMVAKQFNSYTLPVNKALLDLAAVARVADRNRRLCQKKVEEEARRETLRNEVVQEIEAAKSSNPEMMHLQKNSDEAENNIRKKYEERNKMRRLMEELQESTKKFDEEIESLHNYKLKLDQKKEKQTSKIIQTVLKKHSFSDVSSVDLDEEPLTKKWK